MAVVSKTTRHFTFYFTTIQILPFLYVFYFHEQIRKSDEQIDAFIVRRVTAS